MREAAARAFDLRRGWAFSPLGFVRRVLTAAYQDNVPFLASALTFDALVAAVPFSLVVLAAVGHLAAAAGDPVAAVVRLFGALLPPEPGTADLRGTAQQVLAAVADRRGALSALGLPLFLWFSTRLYGGVRVALNEVFDTEELRPWIVGKAVDLGLVLATLVLLLANAGVTLVVMQSPWLGRFLARLSGFGMGVVLFYLVYTVAPGRRVPWDTALVAAAVASLAFEVAKILFAVYITRFATFDRLVSNTNAIAVILLIAWMYYTAVVLLIGGEVAETYDLMRRQREQRAILT